MRILATVGTWFQCENTAKQWCGPTAKGWKELSERNEGWLCEFTPPKVGFLWQTGQRWYQPRAFGTACGALGPEDIF